MAKSFYERKKAEWMRNPEFKDAFHLASAEIASADARMRGTESQARPMKLCDTCIAMPLSIRLPDDLDQRLQALADRTGRSKTFYVTQAVQQHLEDLEDLYLAEQELLALRSGRSKSRPWAEVRAELAAVVEKGKTIRSGRTSRADPRTSGRNPKPRAKNATPATARGSSRPKRSTPQR